MPRIKAAIVAANSTLKAELYSLLEHMPLEIVFETADLDRTETLLARIERSGAGLLFLDLSQQDSAFETIRRVKAAMPGLAVFALNETADPHAILDALRAGVNEYLVPPFGAALETALQRISALAVETQGPGLRTRGRVLGFLSAKGGCGATTIACHLARELPKLTGDKALLTDCDFETGLVSFLFKTKSAYSLLDAAMNVHRLDESYWKAVVSNGVPGLDMIGAPAFGSTQAVSDEQLGSVFDFFKGQYSWILADTGRGLNMQRMSILANCNDIYLVVTTDITALHQAQRTVTRLLEGGYPAQHLHIVLNRRSKQSDISPSELEKMLGAEIIATLPNDEHSLAESYAGGTLASPSTALGKGITELARKVSGLQAEKQLKKRFSFFR